MPADHDTLMEAEHELQRAQLAGDVNALEKLLHDRLRFVGPDGRVHDKAADLSTHEAGLVVFKSSHPVEIEIHTFGNAGLTIALLELELENVGENVTGAFRYTRTWLYEDGRWQIVAGAVVPAKSA